MRSTLIGLAATLVLFTSAPAREPSPPTGSVQRGQDEVINLLLSNETADDFFASGAAARDRNEIGPALVAFLTAYRMEDSRFDAPYEIARLFTARDEADLGWTWLGTAIDKGYWSEADLVRDRVLSPLRAREGFAAQLDRVRANYKAALPTLRGRTEVRQPSGEAPVGGWPVLLCMHGYGTDHRDLVSLAEVGAARGFYAISVCGYEPLGPGRYAWPNKGPEIYRYLDGVIQRFSDKPECNTDVVYTTGFSQGGLVATYLVATHPERFHGALPISPAGPLSIPKLKLGAEVRPLFVLYGTGEGPRMQSRAEKLQKDFEEIGGRVSLNTHPGGHTFPADWQATVERGLSFVRSDDR